MDKLLPLFATLLVSIFYGCATTSQLHSHVELQGEAPESSLLAQIQEGGFVIFFRHAATDHTSQDSDLTQCETQRNLDEKGRSQARTIGQHFEDMKIPVGEVKTSRLCRALDTGKLAFQRATPVEDLTSIVGVPPAVRVSRAKAIKRMLSEMPLQGKNTVLVSHKHMFHDASKVWLEEGEAAIYKPDGQGGTTLVKKVMPNDWGKVLKLPAESSSISR